MNRTLNKIKEILAARLIFLFFIFVFFACTSYTISAQTPNLPDKIRGYKVHRAKITVQNTDEQAKANEDFGVEFKFGEPELADISVRGITLELGAELTVFGQSGTVDFITFKDFEVNGIPVRIEEYKETFGFRKDETFELKKSVEIFVSTRQALRGAAKEWRESKEKWTVTGRVFVFGRFKKFGFSFKRVIPVDVNIKIENPVVAAEQNSLVFTRNLTLR